MSIADKISYICELSYKFPSSLLTEVLAECPLPKAMLDHIEQTRDLNSSIQNLKKIIDESESTLFSFREELTNKKTQKIQLFRSIEHIENQRHLQHLNNGYVTEARTPEIETMLAQRNKKFCRDIEDLTQRESKLCREIQIIEELIQAYLIQFPVNKEAERQLKRHLAACHEKLANDQTAIGDFTFIGQFSIALDTASEALIELSRK